MTNHERKQELRLWFIKNYKGTYPFFDQYKWVEKGIAAGELELRKACIMYYDNGLFKSPQELYDWITRNVIPPCCRE